MDPQACIDELLRLTTAATGMDTDDSDRAFDLLGAYADWRRGGGFQPKNGDMTWALCRYWLNNNFSKGV